jgi:plasmid stabilization system protein ParE
MVDVGDDRHVAQIHLDFPGKFDPPCSRSVAMLQCSMARRTLFVRCSTIATHQWRFVMPRGAYTAKQERKADHIEKSYEKRGVSKKEAEERAWRTVNKQDKGGKNSGHGRSSSRSAAAKKGWETRRRRGNG